MNLIENVNFFFTRGPANTTPEGITSAKHVLGDTTQRRYFLAEAQLFLVNKLLIRNLM